MELFRWIVFGILALLALLLIGYNAYIAVGGMLGRVRNKSWIPILGGLCGVGALLSAPVDGLGFYWWAPLLADWGCIPGFTHTLVAYLSRRRPPHQGRPTGN